MRAAFLPEGQAAPMCGAAFLHSRELALAAAAGMERASASIQIPGRASRNLTLVREKRIIRLI
jgi:hypothetical protein